MTTWLELLRQQFDQVVVDLVCGFRDSNLDVFEFSDHLVVVATPDLPTVRLLQAMTSVLDQLGIPQRKVSLVLNQPAPIPSLSAADVQRYVKLPIQSEIPYGGPDFARAYNAGIPIFISTPSNAAGQAIGNLQRALTVALAGDMGPNNA